MAASAYRSGSKLKDDRNDKTYDYRRRDKGVIESTILAPEGAPAWATDKTQLWNMVEAGEKRKDAQLAREFILAVPPELSDKEQFDLAKAWAQKELVGAGMIAELSLHHTKSGKNPHVHILATLRKLDDDHFSSKKFRDWNDVRLLKEQRLSWAEYVNGALEKAGRPERVDHRSLKDRGIDRIPQPKIGVAATAMKRRGVVDDPERFQLVRRIKLLNEVRPWARAIERLGEVQQRGMGKTWWERSLVMTAEVGRTVRDAILDTWNTLIHARLPGRDAAGPTPDRDMDLSR